MNEARKLRVVSEKVVVEVVPPRKLHLNRKVEGDEEQLYLLKKRRLEEKNEELSHHLKNK